MKHANSTRRFASHFSPCPSQFSTPDDTVFEGRYFGPGDGRAIGCGEFFSELCNTKDPEAKQLYFAELFLCSQFFYDKFKLDGDQATQKRCDRMAEIVGKMYSAHKQQQHYYVSAGVTCNGNMHHAFGATTVMGSREKVSSKTTTPNYLFKKKKYFR